MEAFETWWMFKFSLDARVARCPSVCLIKHTVPKGRRALDELRLDTMECDIRNGISLLSG